MKYQYQQNRFFKSSFFLIAMNLILLSNHVHAQVFNSDKAISLSDLKSIVYYFLEATETQKNTQWVWNEKVNKNETNWLQVFLNHNWEGIWTHLVKGKVEQIPVRLNCEVNSNYMRSDEFYCQLQQINSHSEESLKESERFSPQLVQNQLVMDKNSFFFLPMYMKFGFNNGRLIGLELGREINAAILRNAFNELIHGKPVSNIPKQLECEKVKNPDDNPLGICSYIVLKPVK